MWLSQTESLLPWSVLDSEKPWTLKAEAHENSFKIINQGPLLLDTADELLFLDMLPKVVTIQAEGMSVVANVATKVLFCILQCSFVFYRSAEASGLHFCGDKAVAGEGKVCRSQQYCPMYTLPKASFTQPKICSQLSYSLQHQA